jgi:cytochrome c oxidase subunit IV
MNETAAHAQSQTVPAQAHTGQQHPIRLYLFVWGLLFVLSDFSYMVDYLGVQGYLWWTLMLVFMML